MYNYIIIPTTKGFTLQIGSGKFATRYNVTRKIDAIGIVELIGLDIRPADKILCGTSDIIESNIVNIIDNSVKFDSEVTVKCILSDLEVA